MQVTRLIRSCGRPKHPPKQLLFFPVYGLLITCGMVTWMSLSGNEPQLANGSPLRQDIPRKTNNVHDSESNLVIRRFLIEEKTFCSSRPSMEFLAYVHSSIQRREQRDVTRNTWANITSYGVGVELGVVFVVGRPQNEDEAKAILEESQTYRDIIQVDIGEDYHLLTHKALAALTWISENCNHVPWTIHTDDDMLVDMFLLSMNLRSYDVQNTHHFYCNAMYSRVLREGKWAVDIKEFPGSEYPTFCSGGLWALPTHVIPLLLKASHEVPFLWVDDVYVTGVLPQKANIPRIGDPDGYGSSRIRMTDIGVFHAWHSIKDRKKWWKRIVRIYAHNRRLKET